MENHNISRRQLIQGGSITGNSDILINRKAGAIPLPVDSGLSYNFNHDREMPAQGTVLYDALYSWAK